MQRAGARKSCNTVFLREQCHEIVTHSLHILETTTLRQTLISLLHYSQVDFRFCRDIRPKNLIYFTVHYCDFLIIVLQSS